MYIEGDPILKYKLMLKQHFETGISYLCITKQKRWKEYTGSGVRWKSLLDKIPSPILTHLLFTIDSSEELSLVAAYYSGLFDVVNNPDFANLVPEYGYEGNEFNFEMWKSSRTQEELLDFYATRAAGLRAFYEKDEGRQVKQSSSITMSELYASEVGEDIKRRISETLKAYSITEEGVLDYKRRGESNYRLYEDEPLRKEVASIRMTAMWDNMDMTTRDLRGNKVSVGRLNMSEEAKQNRAIKMTESLANSPARHTFNAKMKVDRIGKGNPASNLISYYGVDYTTAELQDHLRGSEVSFRSVRILLDAGGDSEVFYKKKVESKCKLDVPLVCEYCGFVSDTGIGFTRWHGEKCKMKGSKV